MIYQASPLAVTIFAMVVGLTLGLSFWLGRKARGASGYFAAHGQIPWWVNGVAFAGDYLSAASFLGICGMIAFYGYDGFLYSIGYLAGWIVALFLIAEPIKKLGRFTFADALNAGFQSRGIQVAAGVSTLIVSLLYLIPQMVGAGALVQPLLGLQHWHGVVLVGTVVMVIVITAGMVSTTYVQFLKGALLVVFSLILTLLVLRGGLTVQQGGIDGYRFEDIGPIPSKNDLIVGQTLQTPAGARLIQPLAAGWDATQYVKLARSAIATANGTDAASNDTSKIFRIESDAQGQTLLREVQWFDRLADGTRLVNGQPQGTGPGQGDLHPVGYVESLADGKTQTGPLGPIGYLGEIQTSKLALWREQKLATPNGQGTTTTIYYRQSVAGDRVLRPGEHPMFSGLRSGAWTAKLEFLSLMLALFAGTASLPHILIRYYTVKDAAGARKSTIVGIGCIGFFYILTLYLGLGGMTSGALDPTDTNMAAPLLARSLSPILFAIVSAIAFTTVLGTVSGLILAAAGAVAHDLIGGAIDARQENDSLSEQSKIRIAKIASVIVGILAMGLGVLFAKLNVTYLVGWAFSVAASANLPALVMLIYWPGTTKAGVIAAVWIGMLSALAWILLSADTYSKVYGLPPESALVPFSQPGLVTIPLGFLVLWTVSRITRPQKPAT
jgi:cation/acetate symporter